MRTVLSYALAAATAGAAAAQPAPVPQGDKVIVQFHITPAGPLKPHSRTRLLPDVRQQRHGNQVQGFMKCFMEQTVFFGREESERRSKLSEAPLAELDLRPEELSNYGGTALQFADEAARMQHVDWQILDNLRRDGISTLLPDVQYMRQIAAALKIRTRGRIKAGAFEAAADSAATTLTLGRMCQEQPTLIGGLVGIAICTIGLQSVEEMIQQPGCPNLYWALTDLPVPLVDLRTGSRGERIWPEAHFPRVLTEVWSADEFKKRVAAFDAIVNGPGMGANRVEFAATIARWAADEKRVTAARERLLAAGTAPTAVKAMSTEQTILADEVQRYNVWMDEQTDVMRLPYWEAAPRLKAVEERLVKEKDTMVLAPNILPAVMKVRMAQARLEQNVAVLRTLEAIRLYAYEHGGALPPSLDALSVPVPVDQITGQPFVQLAGQPHSYSLKDGVATFTPTPGQPGVPPLNKVYEIRVRR